MKGLNEWIKAHATNTEDKESFQAIWDATEGYKQQFAPDAENGFARFSKRMNAEKSGRTAQVKSIGTRQRMWQMAAAVALLVVGGAAYFKFTGSPTLVYEEIVTEAKTTKNLSLEDGSTVALNGNSSIEFPTHFTTDIRRVSFSGEAFFEVAKDANRPFVIETKNIDIQVLGTSFNARDMVGEHLVEVFVKTGKVAVTVKKINQRYTLTPGQVLVFDQQTGEVRVSKSIAENPIAWKTRVLKFKDTPLSEIFISIERLFGVEISTQNKEMLDCPYTLTVRAADLKGAFKAVEDASNVKFEQLDTKRFSVKGNCIK